MNYYYTTLDNQTRGPVPMDELRALLQSGTINATCKVAAVGAQEWQPIATVIEVTEIAGSAAGAPPLPPQTVPPVSQSAPSFPASPQHVPGPTEPLAIWSLVLGVLSPFCCGFILGIPAIVCGHMALSRIKQNPALGGRGLAIAGLCLGYIVSLGTFIYLFAMGGLAIVQSLTQHSSP